MQDKRRPVSLQVQTDVKMGIDTSARQIYGELTYDQVCCGKLSCVLE